MFVSSGVVYWTNPEGGTVLSTPTSGGSISTIASGQGSPQGITGDGINVYWAAANLTGNSGIWQAAANGASPALLLTGNVPAAAYSLAVDSSSVFFTTGNGGSVLSVPISRDGLGDEPVTEIATGQGLVSGIAVSNLSDAVYWINNSKGTICSSSKIGGGISTIAQDMNVAYSLVLSNETLYWNEFAQNPGTGAIMSSPAEGTNNTPVNVTSGAEDMWGWDGLATDGTNLYSGTIATDVWYVASISIATGDVTPLFGDPGGNVLDAIAVDANGIYFVDLSNNATVWKLSPP